MQFKSLITRREGSHQVATNPELKPGDFPLGSLESRAAARMMLDHSDGVTHVWISTGLPRLFKGAPIAQSPDALSYYLAPDQSIVQVVCREYEPGQFTAFVDQFGKNGSEYHGDYAVGKLEDLRQFCRPLPQSEVPECCL